MHGGTIAPKSNSPTKEMKKASFWRGMFYVLCFVFLMYIYEAVLCIVWACLVLLFTLDLM
jgi:hypothetical protein